MTCCAPQWSEPAAPWSEPGEIVVCVDLPAEHLPEAAEAVRLWDESLRNWRRMVMRAGPDGPSCSMYVYDVFPDESDRPETSAYVDVVGGRVVHMIRGRYEHDPTGLLLHELGHLLGCQHAAGTLMNPTISYFGPRCPDMTTVMQVAAWHRIDAELLSFCAGD